MVPTHIRIEPQPSYSPKWAIFKNPTCPASRKKPPRSPPPREVPTPRSHAAEPRRGATPRSHAAEPDSAAQTPRSQTPRHNSPFRCGPGFPAKNQGPIPKRFLAAESGSAAAGSAAALRGGSAASCLRRGAIPCLCVRAVCLCREASIRSAGDLRDCRIWHDFRPVTTALHVRHRMPPPVVVFTGNRQAGFRSD